MLSKTAIHAIRAVAALAERPDEFQGASSIAERIGAPQNYLGKLLQNLANANIVFSQKGSGGGFQLRRKPDQITLFDVVDPIDHVSRWNGCFLGRSSCSNRAPCAMHTRWAGVRDAYLDMLKGSTIGDVVNGR